MGQPVQGSTAGSSYQPRTFDQKVSDVQKTYSVAPVGTKTSNLRVGSSGDQVSYVQRQVGAKVDNQYGNETRKKVMDFQKRHGLKVDGIVGDQTMSAMKRAEAMGKLQMVDRAGSAAKETNKFAGPPSGSAAPAPIKPAATTFSGGRTGFSGNAGSRSIKPDATTFSGDRTGFSRNAGSIKTDEPYISKSPKIGKLDQWPGQNSKFAPAGLHGHSVTYRKDSETGLLKAADTLRSLQLNHNEVEMSNPLIDAVLNLHSTKTASNLFEAAKKAKGKDHDADGDKDFADVMIARMVASGMSKDEAIAKVRDKPYNEALDPKESGKRPVEPTKGDMEQHVNRVGKGDMPKNPLVGGKKGFKGGAKDPYSDGMPASEMGLKPNMEEVEFSEAELEHIAAVLEAVGPTPDEYSSSAFGSTGSRSGNISDTVSEEEQKKRGKVGRPPGKYGSYKRKQDAEATTNVSIPHVFHQIRTSRPSDGHYTLQHDMGKDKKGNPIVKTARVSVKDAHNFHQTYLKLEKPDDKSKLTDKFVEKHFNVSKPKATGITLPSLPAKRS